MKNKVLASMVLATIAFAGFAGGVSASFKDLTTEERAEIRTIMLKIKSGEDLNFEEQAKVDELKNQFENKRGFKKGHSGMQKGLTDEEKESLAGMTSEEKKEFFESKREQREQQMEEKKAMHEAHNRVIDKLLAGEELTEEEEKVRAEMIQKRAERSEVKSLMEKKKSGVELSEEEENKLATLKKDKKKHMGGGKGPSCMMKH